MLYLKLKMLQKCRYYTSLAKGRIDEKIQNSGWFCVGRKLASMDQDFAEMKKSVIVLELKAERISNPLARRYCSNPEETT